MILLALAVDSVGLLRLLRNYYAEIISAEATRLRAARPLPLSRRLDRRASRRSLGHDEMSAPILLVARFVMSAAEGPLLAIAHRLDAVGSYAQRHQKVFGRLRPPVSQSQVVFRRATLVAVAF